MRINDSKLKNRCSCAVVTVETLFMIILLIGKNI